MTSDQPRRDAWELLQDAWYWIGRIPAILLDLPIDWPPARTPKDPTP